METVDLAQWLGELADPERADDLVHIREKNFSSPPCAIIRVVGRLARGAPVSAHALDELAWTVAAGRRGLARTLLGDPPPPPQPDRRFRLVLPEVATYEVETFHDRRRRLATVVVHNVAAVELHRPRPLIVEFGDGTGTWRLEPHSPQGTWVALAITAPDGRTHRATVRFSLTMSVALEVAVPRDLDEMTERAVLDVALAFVGAASPLLSPNIQLAHVELKESAPDSVPRGIERLKIRRDTLTAAEAWFRRLERRGQAIHAFARAVRRALREVEVVPLKVAVPADWSVPWLWPVTVARPPLRVRLGDDPLRLVRLANRLLTRWSREWLVPRIECRTVDGFVPVVRVWTLSRAKDMLPIVDPAFVTLRRQAGGLLRLRGIVRGLEPEEAMDLFVGDGFLARQKLRKGKRVLEVLRADEPTRAARWTCALVASEKPAWAFCRDPRAQDVLKLLAGVESTSQAADVVARSVLPLANRRRLPPAIPLAQKET